MSASGAPEAGRRRAPAGSTAATAVTSRRESPDPRPALAARWWHHARHGPPLPGRGDHGHRQPVPPRDRPGTHPRGLRDVPGGAERIGSEPHPAGIRPRHARRDPAHPRAPRPLRPDPARGQGRVPWTHPRDGRDHRACAPRAARFRPPPGGVQQAREPLGAASPGARRGRGRPGPCSAGGRDRARRGGRGRPGADPCGCGLRGGESREGR